MTDLKTLDDFTINSRFLLLLSLDNLIHNIFKKLYLLLLQKR